MIQTDRDIVDMAGLAHKVHNFCLALVSSRASAEVYVSTFQTAAAEFMEFVEHHAKDGKMLELDPPDTRIQLNLEW